MALMKSRHQLPEKLSNALAKSSTIGPRCRSWQPGARSNLPGSTTADGNSVFLIQFNMMISTSSSSKRSFRLVASVVPFHP